MGILKTYTVVYNKLGPKTLLNLYKGSRTLILALCAYPKKAPWTPTDELFRIADRMNSFDARIWQRSIL